jgi:hypothetical protein
MSKDKRQKRFQQKQRHIERQLDIGRTFDHTYYDNDNNRHKLHKLKAFHCSCWMCGNPRKYFHEKTWQETKFYAEGIDDDQ